MTNEQKKTKFIIKANKAHPGENLDYSKVVYVDSKTPVEIIDHDIRPDGEEYGSYWQAPENHVRGQGHPDKRGKKISKAKAAEQNEIIKRFKEVHKGEKLDYSQVKYVNMHTKVKIISHDLRPDGTEYGEFWQEPVVHLKGCTHPDIKKKGRPISVVKKYNSSEQAKMFLSDISKITGIYQNDDGVFVCGKYAFNYIPLISYGRNDILIKTEKYKSNGVSLLNIFEDEYVQKRNIVLEKIQHLLRIGGDVNNASGRKCIVKKVSGSEVKQFLNTYHIQGSAGYTVAYGAFYNDELVAVMTFLNNGGWELNRFCTNTNYNCPGVASKIFTHFIREYNPDSVKSFLDRRWCFDEKNNLYTKLGFKQDAILPPDYRYTNGHGERLHKFGFRKQVLHKKYGLPLTMTETEMTQSLGYYKIWDCGLIRYIWKNSAK